MAWYDLKYEMYRLVNGIPLQEDYISDLLEEDEFVLMIIDACRYDYFRAEYETFFKGKTQRVWSAGNRTPKWTPNLWTGTYDLDYIAGVSFPVAADAYEGRDEEFDPESTFEETIHISFRDPLSKQHPPEMNTDVALSHFQDAERIRGVVHYGQPHEPYLGDTKFFASRIDVNSLREAATEHGFSNEFPDEKLSGRSYLWGEELLKFDLSREDLGKLPIEKYSVTKRVTEGEISDTELRKAYRDNLRLVLSEVERLIQYIDCPVVITADHGEHLGEFSDELDYFHPDQTHPVLRTVPWCVVADESKGNKDLANADINPRLLKEYDTNPSITEIKEQLEALGYQ